MRRLFCFLSVAVILGMAPLSAGTILGNLSGTPLNLAYDIGSHPTGSDEQAEGFTMGAAGDTVSAVSMKFQCSTSSCPYVQSATLGLYTNVSSAPGSLIALFNPITSFAGITASYTFTSNSTIALSANTSYWLVLSAAINPDHFDALTLPESSTLPTGTKATYLGTEYSPNSGSLWVPASDFGYGPFASFYELDEAPSAPPTSGTPEPATASLLLAGAVLIGLRRLVSRRAS